MVSRLKKNTFLAGSAIYLLSNVLNAAIPFTLLPVLTRYLTPEQYGEVAMFQTLLSALAAFVGLSAQAAAGRKFYDGNLTEQELADFIGSCLQILLATSIVTFAVIFALSGKMTEWLSLDIKWILLAVLVAASLLVVQLRLGQWQVRKEATRYGILQVAHSLMNLVLSLLLVITFTQGADGRISAQIIAAAAFALFAIWLLNRDNLLSFLVWRPDYIREALKIGVPLIPHIGGGFLLVAVDRFVINSELGLAQAGIYMVAVQFSAALSLVFDAINKAYVPWLYERLKRGDDSEKRQIVRFTYGWYALILGGAGLAFFVAPRLVTLVAGQAYARAGDVVGWLVLGQVFGGMYFMVTNYIFFSKRTGLLSLVTITSGLINVGLLLLLVGQYGLEGAAYAFCISMGLRFVLTWWVAQKRHPMPWFNFKVQS